MVIIYFSWDTNLFGPGPCVDELLELYPGSVLSDPDNGACSLALRFNLIDSGLG